MTRKPTLNTMSDEAVMQYHLRLEGVLYVNQEEALRERTDQKQPENMIVDLIASQNHHLTQTNYL